MATASFRDIFLAGGDRNINAETSVSIPKDFDCPQVFLLPQDQFSLQPANGQTQRSAGSSFKLSKAHKKQQRIFLTGQTCKVWKLNELAAFRHSFTVKINKAIHIHPQMIALI